MRCRDEQQCAITVVRYVAHLLITARLQSGWVPSVGQSDQPFGAYVLDKSFDLESMCQNVTNVYIIEMSSCFHLNQLCHVYEKLCPDSERHATPDLDKCRQVSSNG